MTERNERMQKLALEICFLNDKINEDVEKGVDLNLEDYSTLQFAANKLAEEVLVASE